MLWGISHPFSRNMKIFTAWRLDEQEKMISLGKLLLLFHCEEVATSRNVLLS